MSSKDIHASYSGIFAHGSNPNSDAESIVDELEHNAPGCTKESIIVPAESYDDIATYLNPSTSSTAADDLLNKLGKLNASKSKNNLLNENDQTTIDNLKINDLENSHDEKNENKVACASTVCEDSLLTSLDSGPDWKQAEWRQHKKHVFILSCAGKPIYTRYGDEDQQASLFGTLLTLSQFLQHTTNHHTEKDVLKCICAGQHRIMFMSQEFMVLVIVSQSLPGQHPEPSHSLMQQLSYIYYQVISILSYSRMKVVYEQRPNYDLRRLLSGAEKFIDSLLESMDRDPGYLLCSVRCLPLDVSGRESIAQAISSNAKIKDLVFALLISGNQLIALIRLKQYLLHPIDLHVLFNLVTSSESFKLAESWTPICLPKFDPNGYLHCHISYLDDACKICLLLLSVNKDSFYVLSECKNRIKEKLTKSNSLNCLSESLSKSSYYQVSHCGIPGLLHFIYKARTTGQFTEPEHSGPYLDQENRERLFSLFRYIYGLMHTPSRPLKIYYHVGFKENILAWVTNHFDMYAVFSPLATKNQAIQMVNKLLKWIKKEENRLFVLSSHII